VLAFFKDQDDLADPQPKFLLVAMLSNRSSDHCHIRSSNPARVVPLQSGKSIVLRQMALSPFSCPVAVPITPAVSPFLVSSPGFCNRQTRCSVVLAS